MTSMSILTFVERAQTYSHLQCHNLDRIRGLGRVSNPRLLHVPHRGGQDQIMKYSVPEDVLIQTLPGGEVVLLNLESESYYGLDEVGARMFHVIEQGGNIDEAVASILDEYEVDAATLNDDLRGLAGELVKHGLLATVD